MTKRRFIGLGRKGGPEKMKIKKLELPDNFILGFTNQHSDTSETEPNKKVNSED